MIIGTYVLNAYCDYSGCSKVGHDTGMEETLGEALKGLRRAGWSFKKDTRCWVKDGKEYKPGGRYICKCPEHSYKKVKK